MEKCCCRSLVYFVTSLPIIRVLAQPRLHRLRRLRLRTYPLRRRQRQRRRSYFTNNTSSSRRLDSSRRAQTSRALIKAPHALRNTPRARIEEISAFACHREEQRQVTWNQVDSLLTQTYVSSLSLVIQHCADRFIKDRLQSPTQHGSTGHSKKARHRRRRSER